MSGAEDLPQESLEELNAFAENIMGVPGEADSVDDGTGGQLPDDAVGGDDTTDEVFLQPDQVPPELQSQYQSMQAAFTRKMQALGKDGVLNKARLFDQMLGDPALRARIMGEQGAQPTQSQGGADDYARHFAYTKDEEDLIKKLDPDSLTAVRAMVNKEGGRRAFQMVQQLTQGLAPILEEFKQLKTSYDSQRAVQTFPQAKGKESEVVALMQKFPGLTMEQAVGAVLGAKPPATNNGSSTRSLMRPNNRPKPTLAAQPNRTQAPRPASGSDSGRTPDQERAQLTAEVKYLMQKAGLV